jgi:hypothetical protein
MKPFLLGIAIGAGLSLVTLLIGAAFLPKKGANAT